jgi:transposase
MLNAIVASEDDPQRLTSLAQGHAPQKTAQLREALRGSITDHHHTLLRLHLEVIAALEHTLTELDTAVGKALAPIRQRARLLTTMPGVSDLTAQVLPAEIDADMTRFPDTVHTYQCRGPVCVRATMRAPANAAAPAYARAAPG